MQKIFKDFPSSTRFITRGIPKSGNLRRNKGAYAVVGHKSTNIKFKNELPLLPIRDLVVYPFMILPLFVGRDSSIMSIEYAIDKSDRLILLAGQKEITVENPTTSDIFDIGTVAMIMRMRKLPDGRIKLLVQGLSKAKITEFKQTDPFFITKVKKIDDIQVSENDVPIQALTKNIKEQLEKVINLGKMCSPDLLAIVEDIRDPGRLADLIASNMNLHVIEAQMILETLHPARKLHKINEILTRELEILIMQRKIKNVTKNEISKTQREYFLREQIKAIKSEFGEDNPENAIQDEFNELREKLSSSGMHQEAKKEVHKQLLRLEKMHPDSSESSIVRNYLDWMLDLPWNKSTKDHVNIDYALTVLNEDHFDLKKVKERVLEYLAVRQLKNNNVKGPILCFSGPPGVGKTSLGKSIAKAIGRKFMRISLGGVKDEAEIRGHRRTYVGAMPGRLIQVLKQVQTNNPVILLDEVDKLGGDFRGDPSSALLEVLDPEQNCHFRDHFLNTSFDLSNIMFIATSNILSDIPAALRDRMEIINLSGYGQEEKVIIAKQYLIPKQLEENGVTLENIEFSTESIKILIQHFTSEAGLRELERKIGTLCRKVAMKVARGSKEKTYIDHKIVFKLLGPAIYTKEDQRLTDEIGMATGLAWTEFGGEILFIETASTRGKAGLTLTGRLGEVMQESAQTALGHIKGHAESLGIPEESFENREFHIHLPSGATPKDGPSAGITLATALISLLTNNPVRHDVAMTGEITLTGRVLPVGGLKEKVLAAMRINIKIIIIPWKNKKDLAEIPKKYRQELTFILVKTLQEVLEIALVDENERVLTKDRDLPIVA